MILSTLASLSTAFVTVTGSNLSADSAIALYALTLGSEERCNLKVDTDKALDWLRASGVDMHSQRVVFQLSSMTADAHKRVAAMNDQTLEWHCKNTRDAVSAFGIGR